jgi:hypothetical protein
VYATDPTVLLLSPDPQPIAYRVSVEETVIGDEYAVLLQVGDPVVL